MHPRYSKVPWISYHSPLQQGFFQNGHGLARIIFGFSIFTPGLSSAWQNFESFMTWTELVGKSHWSRRASCKPKSSQVTFTIPWAILGTPPSGCTKIAVPVTSLGWLKIQLGTDGSSSTTRLSNSKYRKIPPLGRFMASLQAMCDSMSVETWFHPHYSWSWAVWCLWFLTILNIPLTYSHS